MQKLEHCITVWHADCVKFIVAGNGKKQIKQSSYHLFGLFIDSMQNSHVCIFESFGIMHYIFLYYVVCHEHKPGLVILQ